MVGDDDFYATLTILLKVVPCMQKDAAPDVNSSLSERLRVPDISAEDHQCVLAALEELQQEWRP